MSSQSVKKMIPNNEKKIGLVSIVDYANIRNRLQSLSMQVLLKEFGYSSCSLKVNKISFFDKTTHKLSLLVLYIASKKIFKKVYDYFSNNKSLDNKLSNKTLLGLDFTKKYINEDEIDIYKNPDFTSFSKLIAGSDVVWSPYNNMPSKLKFMSLVNKRKRFSYSASIGHEKIPFFYRFMFNFRVKKIENISLREATKGLDKKNLSKTTVDFDPTLLIEKKLWLSYQKKYPLDKNKKLIFVHILNSNLKKDSINKFIVKSYGNKCQIIFSDDIGIGPSQFIYLINKAFLVITDSFHGVAFCLNFEKVFIAIKRDDIYHESNYRIRFLLSLFGLEKKITTKLDSLSSFKNIKFKQNQKYFFYKKKSLSTLKEILVDK